MLLRGVVQGAWKGSQKVQLGREEAFQVVNIQHLASIPSNVLVIPRRLTVLPLSHLFHQINWTD